MGIRIGIEPSGCSGNSYTLAFADQKGPHDEVIEQHGITVYVDPQAMLFSYGNRNGLCRGILGLSVRV